MVSSETLEKINLVFPEQDRKVLLRNILNNRILQDLIKDKCLDDYLFKIDPSLQKFKPINLCQYFIDQKKSSLTSDQLRNDSFDSDKILNKSVDAYQRLILQKNFQPEISDAYLISLLFAQKFDDKTKENDFIKLIDPEKVNPEKNQIIDWIFACLVNNRKEPWVLFQQILCKYPIYSYIEALVNGLIFNLLSDEEIENASMQILIGQNISLCNQYLEILRKKGMIQISIRIAQSLVNTQSKYQNYYDAIQQTRNHLNWMNIGKVIEFIKNIGLLYSYAGMNAESVRFYHEAEEFIHVQTEMMEQLIDESDSSGESKTKNHNKLESPSSESEFKLTSESNVINYSLPVIPYKKINALIQKNEYDEAEKIIQRYLSDGISDPTLFTLSANINLYRGGYLQALSQLKIAFSIHPDDPKIIRSLAQVHFLLGHYKQAYDTFSSILFDDNETNNGDYVILYKYALKSGQPQLALPNIEKWIEENNESHDLLLIAAEAALMEDDYEKASKYLQQAITEKKDQPDSWILLSRLHKENGQVDKSIEALFTGLKYCPSSQVLHLELVKYLIQINNYTQAKKYINELIDLPPESLELGLDISQFLMSCNEDDSARRVLEKALNIWPRSQSLKIELSRILIKQNEHERAVDILEQASNESLLEHEGLKLLILSLFKSSEKLFPISSALEPSLEEKIKKTISILISLSPEDAWGNLFNAVFLTLKAEYPKAYDILSDYLAQPEKASEEMLWRYLLALGQVMVQIGKPESAIPLFERANEIKPNLIEIYIYLSEAFNTLGLNEKAYQVSWHAIQHCEQDGSNIDWLRKFLSKIGKTDLVVDQINKKLTQKSASARELLLLGFLLFEQKDSNQVNEVIRQLISAKMNQDELMQFLNLLIRCHDYKKAKEIFQDEQLFRVRNNRKVNLMRACLDYYDGNLSECEQNLLININEFGFSNLERILLHEVLARASSISELKQLLNEITGTELVNVYLKAAKEFDGLKEIFDIVPENWKNIFICPEEFTNLVLKNYSSVNELQKANEFLDYFFLSHTKVNNAVYEMAADFWRDNLNMEKANKIISAAKQNNIDGSQKIPILLKCLEIELMLSCGNELRAASLLNEVIEKNEDNPRLLAIQSRILLRQSDYENAFNFYEKAKKSLAERDTWILDAALEIGDHEAFSTLIQKFFEAQSVSPYLLSRLLQEKAELFKLNFQLNELKSINKESQHRIKIDELVSKYSDSLSGAIKNHPEIAFWHSINQSLDGAESSEVFSNSEGLRAIYLISFLYRINKNKEALEKMLKDHQTDPEINFQMAMLLSQDNPEQSRQYFINAISRNPRNPLYHAGLSFLEMKNANHAEALRFIEQALQLAPNETDWIKLATAAAELTEKWDKVITFGEAAITANPGDLHSAKKLLHAYLIKGDVLSSEKLIQKMNLGEDKSTEVIIALGKAALIKKNYQKAIDYAHQANKNDPKSADPFVLLAETSIELHQYDQAFEYAQKAVKLKPDQNKAQLVFGTAIHKTRGMEAAIEYLNSIIDEGNHSTAIYACIADLIKDKDGVQQALQYLKSNQVQPDEIISKKLAQYEYDLNNYAQAAEQARLSLSQNPDQPDLIQMLGKIAEKEGNLDQAIKYFYDAISLNSKDPFNYISASNIFIHRREFMKALEILEDGIKRAHENWSLYQQAGKIYWDGKNFQKAEEYFQIAQQLNPSDTRLKRQLDTLIMRNILNTQQGARI